VINIITSSPKLQNAARAVVDGPESTLSAKNADIALPYDNMVNYEDYEINEEINDLVLFSRSEM